MSFAPGQLIVPKDALTCCGKTPDTCTYAIGASACPKGTNPQYCCMPDGSVISALLNSNNEFPYCPTLGALKTSDINKCKAAPVKQCCYQGQCYPSKHHRDSNCYYTGPTYGKETLAGRVVSDCSKCPSSVTCCSPQYNECYQQPFCNEGDLQVSNCGQCPYPTASPINFLSSNGNWMN
jgi:hypothetical protein